MSDAPERLRRVRELFDAAMDQPPAERNAFLANASAWDAPTRQEVQELIAAADQPGVTFDSPLAAGIHHGEPQADSLVGKRLGPYEVVRVIGMGGMGAVYEGVRADEYRKRVAIKLVQGGLDSELTLARFRRERQILANLEHPNVATLLDGGVTPDGRPFLVMEYVEGEPITTWCDARRASVNDRLALFRQLCDAVQYAHKNLVVHGDIKPGNILVTADGTAKLLDFGIAKLVGTNSGDDAPSLRSTQAPSRSVVTRCPPHPTSIRSALCCSSCSPDVAHMSSRAAHSWTSCAPCSRCQSRGRAASSPTRPRRTAANGAPDDSAGGCRESWTTSR
jgi:serine/threonine protein kinase